jgi:hypothetical protein
MKLSTKDWLRYMILDYKRDQPMLLQYLLEDSEIETIARNVDTLLELRLNEQREHKD